MKELGDGQTGPENPNRVVARENDLGRELSHRNSYLKGFSFIGAYKITERAESDNVVSPAEGTQSFLLGLVQQKIRLLTGNIAS